MSVRDGCAVGPPEVRWFVPGDLVSALRPSGPTKRRVDSYSVVSLSPMSSIKCRGDAQQLELKVRVGRVELVRFDRLVGFAEVWKKSRLSDAPAHVSTGRWLDVDKRMWCFDGGEITRLSVRGRRWWTVALELGREGVPARCSRLPDPLIDVVSADGTPHSYASWLLERFGCEASVSSTCDGGRTCRRR